MFIKNIIISGFRSYREQRFASDLSPHNNVIVGRNGSGKSNFFAAVQFVLGEKFSNLRSSERQELFHVGAGRPSLSVFVEIVFDNSDQRISIPGRPDENEVRIRRILGLKQDEFRVNDRKYSAQEVRQLLEAAGFSSSNPYYIVEQGKIVNLANMSEGDRYEILKDVAGTKVYEARREESKRVLADTNVKHGKIGEAIKQLDDRLAELEAETSELKHYQEADRNKRGIEFCIFDEQLRDARGQLEILDSTWQDRVGGGGVQDGEEEKLHGELQQMQRRVEQASRRMKAIEDEKKQLEKERAVLQSKNATLELATKDANVSTSRDRQEKDGLTKEMAGVKKSIEDATSNLNNGKKALATMQAAADAGVDALTAMEVRLEGLQAKRGRKEKFSNKSERDTWIHTEVKRNSDLIHSNETEIKRLDAEVAAAQKGIEDEKKTSKERSNQALKAEGAAKDADKQRKDVITNRDKLNVERRRLWQQVSEQENVVKRVSDDADRSRVRMDRATRNDIRLGLQSLRETIRELASKGDKNIANSVHGQLLDLIEVDPKYFNAVEVTVGNALFNVVVDSFDVSTKLLDHINRTRKPGRLTFLPLDTCNTTPKNIPTDSEVSPLIAHVTYEKKFAGCIAEMLGRTAVATTMDRGAKLVKELDCDVVTIDGDQFNRKGGITGGFFDNRNLKLAAYQALRVSAAALEKEKKTLNALCASVADTEKDITAAMQQLEQLNSQDASFQSEVDTSRGDARRTEEAILRYTSQIEQGAKAKEVLRRHNNAINATNDALKAELKTDISATLSDAEVKELGDLQQKVATARISASSAQSDALTKATDVQLLTDSLHYLERRARGIADRIVQLDRAIAVGGASLGVSGGGVQLKRELDLVVEDLKGVDDRVKKLDMETEHLLKERRDSEERAQTLQRSLVQTTRDQQKQKDRNDAAHNERALLLQKKEDAQAKIRKLGVVPTAFAQKYAKHSVGKLMVLLRNANEELKKYTQVNKKALDQHTQVSEARAGLVEQLEGLNIELHSIDTLMTELDKKKDEAITRTFKQVQYNFENVFKEVVATEGVSASLRMVKNPDTTSDDPYIAVHIEVCFGLGSAVSELGQLSGGQKSLVALALIFAIQRCDPAPFYLFDEIDAALDAEYRTNVANMLKRESKQCQFITATFKNEMLSVADRVLGISFGNKVSRVQYITKEEGKKLLELAANDNTAATSTTGEKRPRDEDDNDADE